MGKGGIRFHSASGHQGVGDADSCGIPKGSSYVEFIVSFQIRTVNDVEDILFIFFPVFPGQRSGNGLDLIHKRGIADAVTVFQRRMHSVHMLFSQFPEKRRQGILPGTRIRYVKNIPDAGSIPGRIDQGDPFGTAPDIPAHGFVPKAVLRAGCRVRTLRENHELFMVGILVQPGGGLQKCSPVLITARDPFCRILCHLNIG